MSFVLALLFPGIPAVVGLGHWIHRLCVPLNYVSSPWGFCSLSSGVPTQTFPVILIHTNPKICEKKKNSTRFGLKVFEILCSGQRILMWLFWCFIWDKKDNSADLRGLLPLYFIGSYSLRLSSKGWSQTDPPVQATGAGSLLQDQWDTKSQHRTFHLKLAADNLKFFVGVTVLWK